MHHFQDGICFERLDTGAVRISKRRPPAVQTPAIAGDMRYWDIEWSVDLPPDNWASAVASVSFGGEGQSRFYAAKDFHANLQQYILCARCHGAVPSLDDLALATHMCKPNSSSAEAFSAAQQTPGPG